MRALTDVINSLASLNDAHVAVAWEAPDRTVAVARFVKRTDHLSMDDHYVVATSEGRYSLITIERSAVRHEHIYHDVAVRLAHALIEPQQKLYTALIVDGLSAVRSGV